MGQPGSGEGQLLGPSEIDFDPDGNVFAGDEYNHRVQCFTSAGSFLGSFGGYGYANGRFNHVCGVAVWPTGARVYVVDHFNCRVQYLNRNEPAVTPESLGKVKALFR